MDEDGFVATDAGGDPCSIECFDRHGEFVWSPRERVLYAALGPSWVLGLVSSGRRNEQTFAVFDRADGKRRATFSSHARIGNESFRVAAARDVVYFTVPRTDNLVAANLFGDELWRVTLGPIAALAAGSGCLYAVERNGMLYRLSLDLG
jgi:hypothetical protein